MKQVAQNMFANRLQKALQKNNETIIADFSVYGHCLNKLEQT